MQYRKSLIFVFITKASSHTVNCLKLLVHRLNKGLVSVGQGHVLLIVGIALKFVDHMIVDFANRWSSENQLFTYFCYIIP